MPLQFLQGKPADKKKKENQMEVAFLASSLLHGEKREGIEA